MSTAAEIHICTTTGYFFFFEKISRHPLSTYEAPLGVAFNYGTLEPSLAPRNFPGRRASDK